MSKERKNCMCTAMLYDPKDQKPKETAQDFVKHSKLYERFMKIKQWGLLKNILRKEKVDMILADRGLIRTHKLKKEKLAK
jgi:hypothetical protein